MMQCFLLTFLILLSTTTFGQTGCIEGGPTLAYWKFDNAKKKETIIVLHGGPAATHQYLRPEFDSLFAMGNVIYYDQRGCGRSAHAESYHWKDHVQDLKRVVRTVSKNRKVILIGSSWGTILALLYAKTYPDDVKGMILSGTVTWHGESMDSVWYKKYHFHPSKENPRLVPRKISEKKIVNIKQADGGYITDTISIERDLPIMEGNPMVETLYSIDTAPLFKDLSKIQTPVLLLTGAQKSCREVAEGYAAILPNSQVFATPHGCHDPWINNPEIFFTKCGEFINNLNKAVQRHK